MDKKELARKRRKKRLMQKRIRRTVVLVLGLLLVFFAGKGLVGLMTGQGVDPSSQIEVTPTPEITPEPTPSIPQPNEYCTLVSAQHPLGSDYEVETREIICNGAKSGKQFDVRVIDKLEMMLTDCATAGYPLIVRSAHRTVSYQKMLYTNKVNEYLNAGYAQAAAEAEAGKWVAPPGTSEHNLGIVVDIVNSDYVGELEQYFEESEHFKWLYQNCADYGFILRYPKGKEAVTGIVYEPWHYRFVGEEIARYIMDNNLTLEEYWEEVNNGKSQS